MTNKPPPGHEVRRKRITQYAGLVGANAASVAVNIATVLILTRVLSQSDFGSYRYAVTFFNAVAVVAQLGLPFAASVLLTRAESDDEERRIITATAVMMLMISAVISLGIAAFVTIASSRGADIAPPLLAAYPFVYTAILQVAYIEMLKGANRIADIAAQMLMPYLLIVVVPATSLLLTRRLDFQTMVFVHVSAYTITHLVTLWRFRKGLVGWLTTLRRQLMKAVRSTGRQVYVGSVFAIGSTHVLGIMLGRSIGMEGFAVYALALAMSSPVQVVPAVMGTVMFRRNAQADKLDVLSTRLTLVFTAGTLISYLILIELLFPVVFPPQYLAASKYAILFAFSFALYGIGDYFNRFIGAHGHGRYIQISAITAGLVNVCAALTLVHQFEIGGMVIASWLASVSYVALMVYFYKVVVAINVGTRSPEGNGMTL